jgi:hypothetical protein
MRFVMGVEWLSVIHTSKLFKDNTKSFIVVPYSGESQRDLRFSVYFRHLRSGEDTVEF